MRTRKQICTDRIKRIVEHRDKPAEPVDAATMLHIESQRLAIIGHPLSKRMSWAMRLAAAKLEAWGDPSCLTRYVKVTTKKP